MRTLDRFTNNLDKQDDMDIMEVELELKPFNSGESFRTVRPRDRHRFVENRRRYYEMRSFLRGDGRED